VTFSVAAACREGRLSGGEVLSRSKGELIKGLYIKDIIKRACYR
jgi:hypothetical protein